MFDQRPHAILAELGPESNRIVAFVGGQTDEFVDVSTGEFQPDFGVVRPPRRAIHVDDRVGSEIDQERRFHRLDGSIDSSKIVRRGALAGEKRRVDCHVTGLFEKSGRPRKEDSPYRHRCSIKRPTERR